MRNNLTVSILKRNIVAVRLDDESIKKLEKTAKRLKTTKSSLLNMGLEKVFADADQGIIRLLPEKGQAQHDHSPKKVTVM